MWRDRVVMDNVKYGGKVMGLMTRKSGDVGIKISYWLLREGEEFTVYSNILFHYRHAAKQSSDFVNIHSSSL